MSVFSALLMDPVKPPSENSMAGHLWWLADQLRTRQLQDLVWCDTRDMRADPMTKGTIGRDLILDVMNGTFKYVRIETRYRERLGRTVTVGANQTLASGSHTAPFDLATSFSWKGTSRISAASAEGELSAAAAGAKAANPVREDCACRGMQKCSFCSWYS